MSTNRILDTLLAQPAPAVKRTVKQQKIVEAAIKMFAEKGYSNTSTAEIAKLAEVSEGTIFKHYGTKDHLLLSLIVPYIKQFFPSIADEVLGQTASNPDAGFETFLRAFLQNRIAFISENREIFQVLVKELIYKEDLKNELFPHIAEIVTSRLAPIINRFKERGEIVQLPTSILMNRLFTFFGGFLISRLVFLNMASISDDELEDAIRFIMDGMRGQKSAKNPAR